MLSEDFVVLFGAEVGEELYEYYLENEKFNPQALWGFVSEAINRPSISLDESKKVDLCSFPTKTWKEISQTGRLLRRGSIIFLGYDPVSNTPSELKKLYDVLLVAEEAEALQAKLKKRRSKKLSPLKSPFICKYCWRDIEQGGVCELHKAGMSERKKADRRKNLLPKQLKEVRFEMRRTEHPYNSFSSLKAWADKNRVSFEDKSKLLELLDGREGVNYSVGYLVEKQCAILNMDSSEILDPERLLTAVLVRAEAYLRADAIVVSKKGG